MIKIKSDFSNNTNYFNTIQSLTNESIKEENYY